MRITPVQGHSGSQAPEGSFNFRDLGGWPAAEGGTVRTGLVYRCGHLDGLTDAGWRYLVGLGIKGVYDLRSDAEVNDQAASATDVGITLHRVPIWGAGSPADTLYAPAIAEDGRGAVARYAAAKVESYARMPGMYARDFGVVISGLAYSSGLPAVIHCAAGKDRTGIVAALLLRLLGVDETDVLADYLASREGTPAWRREPYLAALRAADADEAEFGRVHGAHPPALAAALRQIDARWGSVEEYLTEAAGVTRDDIGTLRRLLTAYPG